MPSLASLNAARRLMDRLVIGAKRDLNGLGLSSSERVLMSSMLADGWVALIDKYGSQAAEIGAEQFDQWAKELGIRPKVKVAKGVNERQATASLGYALSTPNQRLNALEVLDRLILQPYRDTVQTSAWASGGAWARVPAGAKPCAFCLMLASRGEVYQSEESAGGLGNEYHGDCRCIPTLVAGKDSYPEGYDPDALYKNYDAAASAAVGNARLGRDQTAKILAELRRQNGTN